jgi:hypothetical protein
MNSIRCLVLTAAGFSFHEHTTFGRDSVQLGLRIGEKMFISR